MENEQEDLLGYCRAWKIDNWLILQKWPCVGFGEDERATVSKIGPCFQQLTLQVMYSERFCKTIKNI